MTSRVSVVGDDRAMSSTPRPSPLTGTEPLTWWTLTRLLSWTLRWRISGTSTRWLPAGFVVVAMTATTIYLSVHGVQLAAATLVSGGIVLGATTAGVVGAPALIAAGALAWARLRPGWAVGYVDNTAGLIVRPNGPGVWTISDHVARRPGQSEAADVRRRVFAHLRRRQTGVRYASSPTPAWRSSSTDTSKTCPAFMSSNGTAPGPGTSGGSSARREGVRRERGSPTWGEPTGRARAPALPSAGSKAGWSCVAPGGGRAGR